MGHSLSRWRGPRPRPVMDVLGGLSHAHGAGACHGNIQPLNIVFKPRRVSGSDNDTDSPVAVRKTLAGECQCRFCRLLPTASRGNKVSKRVLGGSENSGAPSGPGGAAAAELVSLVRSLQRGTGGFYAASWRAQALDELKSALLLAHHYDADSAAAVAASARAADCCSACDCRRRTSSL